jgi:hypothetical protein
MAKMTAVFNTVRVPLIALPPLRYGGQQWQGNRYSDMGGPAFLVLKGCVHRPVVAYRIRLDLPFDCWFVE